MEDFARCCKLDYSIIHWAVTTLGSDYTGILEVIVNSKQIIYNLSSLLWLMFFRDYSADVRYLIPGVDSQKSLLIVCPQLRQDPHWEDHHP